LRSLDFSNHDIRLGDLSAIALATAEALPPSRGRFYRFRWQIELFFKALKQNLRIKTFVGTSENAVKTQIWTAMAQNKNILR